jgi:hypothetical protein
MLSDTFHRQNVQRLSGLSCKRELHPCFFFLPLFEVSTVQSNLFLRKLLKRDFGLNGSLLLPL